MILIIEIDIVKTTLKEARHAFYFITGILVNIGIMEGKKNKTKRARVSFRSSVNFVPQLKNIDPIRFISSTSEASLDDRWLDNALIDLCLGNY